MKNKKPVGILLIILFHLVGVLGFTLGYEGIFLKLVPFHLMLMSFVLFSFHTDWNRNFLIFVCSTFIFTFLIEMIGTNTGLLFGAYSYGKTLGFKINGTPLLIGINWLVLVYCSGTVLSRLKSDNSVIASLLGAIVLTTIDFILEPVAIRYDYWTWADGFIPVRNYVAWFILAFLLHKGFFALRFRKQNPVAAVLLLTEIVFFIILRIQ